MVKKSAKFSGCRAPKTLCPAVANQAEIAAAKRAPPRLDDVEMRALTIMVCRWVRGGCLCDEKSSRRLCQQTEQKARDLREVAAEIIRTH